MSEERKSKGPFGREAIGQSARAAVKAAWWTGVGAAARMLTQPTKSRPKGFQPSGPAPAGGAVMACPQIADFLGELRSAFTLLDGILHTRLDASRQRLMDIRRRLDQLSPRRQVQNGRQRLDDMQERMARALAAYEQLRRARLDGLQQRLHALNPLAVMQRGFAVVHSADGRLLSSVRQISIGDEVSVRMTDGSFGAQVNQVVRENKEVGLNE